MPWVRGFRGKRVTRAYGPSRPFTDYDEANPFDRFDRHEVGDYHEHQSMYNWKSERGPADMSGERWIYLTFKTRTQHGRDEYSPEPDLEEMATTWHAKSQKAFETNTMVLIQTRSLKTLAKLKKLEQNIAPSPQEIHQRSLSNFSRKEKNEAIKNKARPATTGLPRIDINKSLYAHDVDRYPSPFYEESPGIDRSSPAYPRYAPSGLPNEAVYYEKAFGPVEVLAFGSSRSGYGAKESQFIRKRLRHLYKGKLQQVSEMGKKITAAIREVARKERDLLLSALREGCDVRDGGDPAYKSIVSYGSSFSLADLAKMGHPYGYKRSIEANAGAAIERSKIPYTFARQDSDGTGDTGSGKSIWEALQPVDDERRRVYGIRWADAQAAYIYNNFLVAGTSKMVPRPGFHDINFQQSVGAKYLVSVYKTVKGIMESPEHRKP